MSKLWLRYVDEGKNYLNEFLNHINNLIPTIKLMMEMEKERTSPAYSRLKKLMAVSSLRYLYRKPTYIEQYLQYESNLFIDINTGIIGTLYNIEDLNSEIQNLSKGLQNNICTRRLMTKTIQRIKLVMRTVTSPVHGPHLPGTSLFFSVVPFVVLRPHTIVVILPSNDLLTICVYLT